MSTRKHSGRGFAAVSAVLEIVTTATVSSSAGRKHGENAAEVFTTATELSTAIWVNATNYTSGDPPLEGSVAKLISISFVVAVLSILTAGGNLMVIISFKLDKQLQTISNYFLLSLSVADFAIGIISMPLYTVYLLMNRWPLGSLICDIWLSLDYTMSNASVANLLVICFDRYLSVTRPLTYRARRTPKKAALMIGCAWLVSAVMWTPWIFAWPHIEGKRTVPDNQCYIQFLDSNPYITVVTAFAAFYLPVLLMCILYFKIYLETEKRQKEFAKLQAVKGGATERRSRAKSGGSSDDEGATLRTDVDDFEDLEVEGQRQRRAVGCWLRLRRCCRIDREYYQDDSSSSEPGSPAYDRGADTPSSSHNASQRLVIDNNARKNSGSGSMIPLMSLENNSASKCSLNRYSSANESHPNKAARIKLKTTPVTSSCDPDAMLSAHPPEPDSELYTIVIRLPEDGDVNAKPSIKMIPTSPDAVDHVEQNDLLLGDHVTSTANNNQSQLLPGNNHHQVVDSGDVSSAVTPSIGRRLTESSEALRDVMTSRIAVRNQAPRSNRARRRRQERKQDRKAAKTLSAILVAFIVTWTPYNVFTVINAICTASNSDCAVKGIIYDIGYWLCYINSTINPVCYALCNVNFRRTYWRILTCKFWKSSNRAAMY